MKITPEDRECRWEKMKKRLRSTRGPFVVSRRHIAINDLLAVCQANSLRVLTGHNKVS